MQIVSFRSYGHFYFDFVLDCLRKEPLGFSLLIEVVFRRFLTQTGLGSAVSIAILSQSPLQILCH